MHSLPWNVIFGGKYPPIDFRNDRHIHHGAIMAWYKKTTIKQKSGWFWSKKAKPPNDYYSLTVDAILCRNSRQILRINKICGSGRHRCHIWRVIVFLRYWIPTLFWGCTTHCICLAYDKGPELSAFLNGLEWCVWYNTVVNTSPNGKELNDAENIKKGAF